MFKQIIAGFIGALISIVCIVPPILHFVTGPLGPFIGGFIGGLTCTFNKHSKYIIGLTIGFILASTTILTGFVINKLGWNLSEHYNDIHLPKIFEVKSLIKFSIVIFIYASTLGIIGVHLSMRLKKHFKGPENSQVP